MGSCDRAAGSVWKGAIRCVTWSTGIMKKKAESKLSQGSQITLVLTLKEEILYQKEEEQAGFNAFGVVFFLLYFIPDPGNLTVFR